MTTVSLQDIELFCYGGATVLDTAVLLVLLEKGNRKRSPSPLYLLVFAVWLFHTATFCHSWLSPAPGMWMSRILRVCLVSISVGLLLMPSAMLHAWVRAAQRESGKRLKIWIVPVLYLPLGVSAMVALNLPDPRGKIMDVLGAYTTPYLFWLCLVNTIAAVGFYRLRSKTEVPWMRAFYSRVSLGLVILLVLDVTMGILDLLHVESAPLFLMLAMSPVLLTLLLTYTILRFNFLQIVLERSIVYGAIILAVLLFDHVFLSQLREELSIRYQVDFKLMSVIVIVIVILLYQPFRERTAEALRYLMGERMATQRDQLRRLSVQMTALSGQPPTQVMSWFQAQTAEALSVSFVYVWTFSSEGSVATRGTGNPPLSDEDAASLHRILLQENHQLVTVHRAPGKDTEDLLTRAKASTAVVLSHPEIQGLALIGGRSRNRQLTEELLGMTQLLTEQLGITLNNSLLQADRLAAERRAMQNEKLSTLGLVASSIAHEVKNPLSSIKTIVTVLEEDMEKDAPGAEDLRIVRSEVDRLSATVTRLLSFVRPSPAAGKKVGIVHAVQETLHVLGHVARKTGSTLKVDLPDSLPIVEEDETALREIFFNLISNGLDAAGPGGVVNVCGLSDETHLTIEVRDSGPGIPPEVQDRLFEPFVTTKNNGTGLGLYLVGRTLRELGAHIHCETEKTQGTVFSVRFPRKTEAS